MVNQEKYESRADRIEHERQALRRLIGVILFPDCALPVAGDGDVQLARYFVVEFAAAVTAGESGGHGGGMVGLYRLSRIRRGDVSRFPFSRWYSAHCLFTARLHTWCR